MSNLSVLPYGWRVDKLGNLLEKIVGGGTPSREKEKFWNGEIPWATVKDLRKTILHRTEESITKDALRESASNLIPRNTLIIATRMALGKVALFTQDVAINQDLKALFPAKELTQQFLFHWLLNHAEAIERLGSGSTVKGIRLEVLKGMDLLLPPLTEQQKIAEILSTVDEKVAVIDEQLAKTIELKTGLMQRLLTKGISHTEFRDSALGEIPKEWQSLTFNDLVKFSGGAQPPRSTFAFEPQEGYIRFVQTRDYRTEKYKTYIPEKLARRKCSKDDIMIGRYGPPIFQILRGIEGAYNVALIKAIPNEKKILREYLFYYISRHEVWAFIENLSQRGGGQTGVDLDELKKYPFPLPPLPEQQKIVEVLATVDKKIQVLRDKKVHYHTLKRGLMQQLLTGKLRVQVTQDPVPA